MLRHRVYIGLKIAKTAIPGIARKRLLKRSPRVDRYDYREILTAEAGNDFLYSRVSQGTPVTAGKIGDCELEALVKFEDADGDAERFFHSIERRGHEMDLLYANCGVFPREAESVARWARIYRESLSTIDLLAVWHNQREAEIVERYAPQATLTRIRGLEGFYHENPWTRALSGKRVLVVTPFEQTITAQRARYTGADLFPSNPETLPDFELSIVRSPFSPALREPRHTEWATALEQMKEEIARAMFDVCLIGAGAYSLPLCGFIKTQLDRTAIHLGGTTQVLFGVRGKRFDRHPEIQRLYNDNWTRPLPTERPRARWRVEGGAYW